MKLRSMRGPNWVEASVSVTIVIENTMPTTVITAADSVARISRAASAVPKSIHDGSVMWPANAARSTMWVTKYRANAAINSAAGTTHRLVRSVSRRHSERHAAREIMDGGAGERTSGQRSAHADQASRLTASDANAGWPGEHDRGGYSAR